MVDYKLIGSRIKKRREELKFTQELLAEKADITSVYLSKIENGKVRPTLDTLSEICAVIELDLGNLLLNSVSESGHYQTDRVVQIFNSCSPKVKPIALDLLEQLSKL